MSARTSVVRRSYQGQNNENESITKAQKLKTALAVMSTKSKNSAVNPIKLQDDINKVEEFLKTTETLDSLKNHRKFNPEGLHKSSRTTFIKPFEQFKVTSQTMKVKMPFDSASIITQNTICPVVEKPSYSTPLKKMIVTQNNGPTPERRTTATPNTKSKNTFTVKKASSTAPTTPKNNKKDNLRKSNTKMAGITKKYMPQTSALLTPVRKSMSNNSGSAVKNQYVSTSTKAVKPKRKPKTYSQHVSPNRHMTSTTKKVHKAKVVHPTNYVENIVKAEPKMKIEMIQKKNIKKQNGFKVAQTMDDAAHAR